MLEAFSALKVAEEANLIEASNNIYVDIHWG